MPRGETDLYEVMIVPDDPDLHKDLDLRVHTFAARPSDALDKVRRYIREGRNQFSRLIGPFDFVVHKREFLE